MATGRAGDLDEFLDDADDFEGGDAYEIVVDDAGNKKRVKKPVKAKQASWRSIEDYMENKRLKRQLSEFYDDDKE
jgi:ribosomal protein S4